MEGGRGSQEKVGWDVAAAEASAHPQGVGGLQSYPELNESRGFPFCSSAVLGPCLSFPSKTQVKGTQVRLTFSKGPEPPGSPQPPQALKALGVGGFLYFCVLIHSAN